MLGTTLSYMYNKYKGRKIGKAISTNYKIVIYKNKK